MRSTTLKSMDAGRRVQGFVTIHLDVVGSVVPAALRARLDAAVANGTAYRAEQSAMDEAAQGETLHLDALRNDVFERFLHPIGLIARQARREVPDFPALLVVSSTKRKSSFVQDAETVVDAAAKYADVFVNGGQPADFVAQVKTILGQMSASFVTRDRYFARRAAATKGLEAAETAVRDIIRILDGSIKPLLRKDPALLADWNASKRIHQTVSTPLPGGDTTEPTEGTAPDSPAPLTQSGDEPPKAAA